MSKNTLPQFERRHAGRLRRGNMPCAKLKKRRFPTVIVTAAMNLSRKEWPALMAAVALSGLAATALPLAVAQSLSQAFYNTTTVLQRIWYPLRQSPSLQLASSSEQVTRLGLAQGRPT
jgi:hypothetical protein